MNSNETTAQPLTGWKKIWHIAGKICKVIVPLGISIVLVFWLLKEVHFKDIVDVIHRGIRFEFLIIMMALTAISFMIRGIRWGIQLRAAGIPRMSPVSECVSIFGAYALNLLVQGVGEAWRCLYVVKKRKAKLSTVVGTDLGDRGSDGIMILLITILTYILASGKIHDFLNTYKFGQFLIHLFSRWELYTGVAAILVLFILADIKWKKTKFFQGFNTSLIRIWEGFRVLFVMKGRWTYLVMTLGIWICYYFETYSCFYAFPFTRELTHIPDSACGFIPGLVVFVFGAFSMIIPSTGGLGAWNIAVTYGLMLYGVPKTEAITYSLVVWGFQAAMIILLGIFSAIYIMTGKDSDSIPDDELPQNGNPDSATNKKAAQNLHA